MKRPLVRLVGPLAHDKRTDPAILSVDDAGRFVFSVLGRRGTRADDLTREIARALGAIPVITTNGDSRVRPVADGIGEDPGSTIERA